MPLVFPYPPHVGDEILICDHSDFISFENDFINTDLMKYVFAQSNYYTVKDPAKREVMAVFFSIAAIYRVLFGLPYTGTIHPTVKGVVFYFGLSEDSLVLIAAQSDKYTHVVGDGGFINGDNQWSNWSPEINNLIQNFIFKDIGYKMLDSDKPLILDVSKQSLLRLIGVSETLHGGLSIHAILNEIDGKLFLNLGIEGAKSGEFFLGLPHPPRYLDSSTN